MSKLITAKILQDKKDRGEKITMLTAYDATLAGVCADAGIDSILIGDSLGMLVQGHPTTVPVSIDDMIYHARAVVKAAPNTLKMLDMPFMSYTCPNKALDTASRLMQTGVEILKVELSTPQISILEDFYREAVPICAHLGLTPQQVHRLGGYRTLGKNPIEYKEIINMAKISEQQGAMAILLECVPAKLAKVVTETVSIPVIGIGSGTNVDGQVLVIYDVLGISKYIPKFAKDFLKGQDSILAAVQQYHNSVKNGSFPIKVGE